MKPFFIIVIGPTGAGKTRAANEAIYHLLKKSDVDVPRLLIDDLIEADDMYKSQVAEILKTNRLSSKPDEKVVEQFNKAYFAARKSGCGNAENGCDAVNDARILQIISRGETAVFETTGRNVPTWVLQLVDSAYEVVFVLPFVRIPELIKRNIQRTLQSVTNFKADPKKYPAPRLPDISLSSMCSNIGLLQATIETVLLKGVCVKGVCSKTYRMLLYDNNPRDMSLILDTRDTDLRHADIARVFYDYFDISLCEDGENNNNTPNIKTGKRRRKTAAT